MSTRTIWRWSTSATPSMGSTVVKAYSAILGRAALTTLSKVDLPALGTPAMPTSATSFSSSASQCSSPGSPFSAMWGAFWREVLKAALPRPPRPPRAAWYSWPGCVRSATIAPVSPSRTRVPGGTGMRRSLPLAPAFSAPEPCTPRSARWWTLCCRE